MTPCDPRRRARRGWLELLVGVLALLLIGLVVFYLADLEPPRPR